MIRQLDIPPLGSALKLVEDWDVILHIERRNTEFLAPFVAARVRRKWQKGDDISHYPRDIRSVEYFHKGQYSGNGVSEIHYGLFVDLTPSDAKYRDNIGMQIKIPAGTVLVIDRYYIRKGCTAYDSISFTVKKFPDSFEIQRPPRARFWAKLADTSRIRYMEAK